LILINYSILKGYSFIEYSYILHGVKVRVLVDKNILKYTNLADIKNFTMYVFKYFHRHWTIYQAYPLNEYRFVVLADKKGVLSEGTEFGIVHGKDIITEYFMRGEPLSHIIGHSWNGGILKIERNLPDGLGFDPRTQDSDKCWGEGWEHFNGIICLDWNGSIHKPLNMLQHDLELYRKEIVNSSFDMPLVDMAVLFQTPHMYYYYAKGGLIFYLINKILMDYDNKTLNDFTRYLYKKYNITSFKELESIEKRLSAEDLLLELNKFSTYNFTSFFEKYIYGCEALPLKSIEEKYILALREFNETAPLVVDKIPPIISLIRVKCLEPSYYSVYWEAKDLGKGIDHYEVQVDNSGWINIGTNQSYVFSIESPGEHTLLVKVIDKAGNSRSVSIKIEILTITRPLHRLI